MTFFVTTHGPNPESLYQRGQLSVSIYRSSVTKPNAGNSNLIPKAHQPRHEKARVPASSSRIATRCGGTLAPIHPRHARGRAQSSKTLLPPSLSAPRIKTPIRRGLFFSSQTHRAQRGCTLKSKETGRRAAGGGGASVRKCRARAQPRCSGGHPPERSGSPASPPPPADGRRERAFASARNRHGNPHARAVKARAERPGALYTAATTTTAPARRRRLSPLPPPPPSPQGWKKRAWVMV